MEILIGFAIAMVVGLTGMGGGPLAVPVLTLWLGLPAEVAVGTSLVFVTVTKLTATPVYFLRQQIDLSVMKRLLAGGLPGVALGSLVLNRMSAAQSLQPVILAVVGVTIVIMASVSLWKLAQPRLDRPAAPRLGLLPWLTFPIGLEVGFSSAGAGALGSLVLMYFTALPMNRIVGTELLFGLVLSSLGGGLHLAAGSVDGAVLGNLCTGGILGAAVGAQLGSRMPVRPLRAVLNTLLVYLGGSLCWKGIQVLVR